MAPHPKKTLIFEILKVLETYTDKNHPISQQEIVEKLRLRGVTVDRKSIKRNIEELIEMGHEIHYTAQKRSSVSRTTGEIVDSTKWTNIYIERKFTDSELHLIISSLMASRNIPYNQVKELVHKVESLSNERFHKMINLPTPADNAPNAPSDLFQTIALLDDAISNNLQITMNYSEYRTDKKLHLKSSSRNKEYNEAVTYTISPYYITSCDARLYLLASYLNHKREWTQAFYRIDRIANVIITENKCFPKNKVYGYGPDFDLKKFRQEYLYMLYPEEGKETVRASFRIPKWLLGDLFDMFTGPVFFRDETKDYVTVSTRVSYKSIRKWALFFAEYVIVLSPSSLVDDIKNTYHKALAQYENGGFNE